MNIGYIGLGDMGGALARRLQTQHPLFVFDLSQSAMAALKQHGATPCESLEEVAARCDVIMLCLPTSAHVRTVLFGENGLAKSLKPETLIIDQTSGDPAVTRSIANELLGAGVHFLDAPVSGGPEAAEAGTIAIMVGASSERFEQALPILKLISPNVFHVGDVGCGHVMKLVNNLVSGAQRLLSLEALTLAAKNGIDPKAACDVLVAGGAKNVFLEKFFRQRVLTGKMNVGFTLALMHKDLRLACQLGAESSVPMFFGNLAREMYQLCISEKGGNANMHTCTLVMDRLAGTQVVPVDHDLN